MLFPGFPGIATAVGLFALIWLFIYLESRGKPVVFDPGGKHGKFGRRLRSAFLYPIPVHAKPVTWIRRARLFLYQLYVADRGSDHMIGAPLAASRLRG